MPSSFVNQQKFLVQVLEIVQKGQDFPAFCQGTLLENELTSPDMAPTFSPKLRLHQTIFTRPHMTRLQLSFPGLEQGKEEGSLQGNLRHPGTLHFAVRLANKFHLLNPSFC